MSTSLQHYHDDGANRQTQAALAMFQHFLGDGIESSWSDQYKCYEADILIARWENCREQGYVLTLRSKNYKEQLNIAIFEHRNVDSVCAIKWHQRTMNSPTIDTAEFGDECYKDKYDTSFDVTTPNITDMAEWLVEEFTNFWDKHEK